jgi:hypothetical protein
MVARGCSHCQDAGIGKSDCNWNSRLRPNSDSHIVRRACFACYPSRAPRKWALVTTESSRALAPARIVCVFRSGLV